MMLERRCRQKLVLTLPTELVEHVSFEVLSETSVIGEPPQFKRNTGTTDL